VTLNHLVNNTTRAKPCQGSRRNDIAGIYLENFNVLGLKPPENLIAPLDGGTDGCGSFELVGQQTRRLRSKFSVIPV
jgi:hypothetical protein